MQKVCHRPIFLLVLVFRDFNIYATWGCNGIMWSLHFFGSCGRIYEYMHFNSLWNEWNDKLFRLDQIEKIRSKHVISTIVVCRCVFFSVWKEENDNLPLPVFLFFVTLISNGRFFWGMLNIWIIPYRLWHLHVVFCHIALKAAGKMVKCLLCMIYNQAGFVYDPHRQLNRPYGRVQKISSQLSNETFGNATAIIWLKQYWKWCLQDVR